MATIVSRDVFCDRCGKKIDLEKPKIFSPTVYRANLMGISATVMPEVDFCAKCYDDFKDFLKEGKS